MWVTVVGVMAIILGCFGLLGAGQLVVTPKIMELQKEIFSAIQEDMEAQSQDPNQPAAGGPPPQFFRMFERFWNLPNWYKRWCVVAGMVSIFLYGFYILAAVCLLQTKSYAVKLFYLAVAVSIATGLAKGIVTASAMSFLGIVAIMGAMFGVVINVVLLIVVATADKEVFTIDDA